MQAGGPEVKDERGPMHAAARREDIVDCEIVIERDGLREGENECPLEQARVKGTERGKRRDVLYA